MKKKLKRFFHKFFKIFIIFMLITLVVNLGVILAVYINHRNKLGNEKVFLEPPGEMVEVNGHNMHVLLSGNEESEYTLPNEDVRHGSATPVTEQELQRLLQAYPPALID